MTTSLTSADIESCGYAQQVIQMQCEVCDTTQDVTSHCTECLKTMCVVCEQSHTKLYKKHKIITIFEGLVVKHINTKCQTHHLVFSHYCENCQKNICSQCQNTTHTKCSLVAIENHAKMLKTILLKRVEKHRKTLPEIDINSDIIKDHLTNFDKTIENQIDLVQRGTTKRHKYLDAEKSELMKQLESKQASAHKTLYCTRQNIQNLRTSIDDITTSIKKRIDLVPDAGILQFVNESNAKLDSTSIKTTFDLPNPFTYFDQGNNQLGSLQDNGNTTLIFDTRIESHDTSPFQTPSKLLRRELSVTRVLSLAGDIVSCTTDGIKHWLGLDTGLYSDEVQLFDQHGDQLLRFQMLHGVHYIAITTECELLVSGWDTTVISRVNKSGKIREFIDLSAPGVMCARGLVTTRQDDVFVCVRMTGIDKVLMFSSLGKKISELNSHFFTSSTLYGIHAVSRDTFCVLDGEGREGSRLVFVNGEGQLVRHIDRTTAVLQRDITAVAGDRYGHLIVATCTWVGMSCIHVLSGEGTCKRTYPIQNSGKIQGVSVGEDDVLWIGTTKGTRKLILAKYLE